MNNTYIENGCDVINFDFIEHNKRKFKIIEHKIGHQTHQFITDHF